MQNNLKYVLFLGCFRLKYGWFMFAEVFEVYSWLAIILIFLSARLLVYLRRQIQILKHPNKTHSKSELSNIKMYGFFINQPGTLTEDVQNSIFLKIIVILILFSSVLLVTAYNSRLSSVVVAPVYENDINTLDELADSSLRLLFFDAYYDILSKDKRKVYKTLYDKIYLIPNNTDFELSKRLLYSGKYAVARYRRVTGGYYEFEEHLIQMHGRYKPITPMLFTNYYYFTIRKNSMHTMELGKIVENAFEAGLLEFWEADVSVSINFKQYVIKK